MNIPGSELLVNPEISAIAEGSRDYIPLDVTAAAAKVMTGKVLDTAERAAAARDWLGFSSWIKVRDRHDFILAETTEGGRYGMELWERMELDPHLYNVIQTRKAAVLALPRSILPWDKSDAAKEQADFIENALNRIRFHQGLKDLLDAVPKGFAVSEIMWGQDEKGRWVPFDIRARMQRRFLFGWQNELRLWGPLDPWPGTIMPPNKFIVASFDPHYDNAWGNALMAKCFWPWWFKKYGLKFWMVFLEKFGQPTVKGKFPPGANEEQKDALLAAIEAMASETGVIIPNTQELELMEAQRTGATDSYERFCAYLDRQMSKAVVGGTLSTDEGSSGGGNRALGNVHREALLDLVSDDAQMLEEAVNRCLIRPMIDFNFGVPPAGQGYPYLHIETQTKDATKDMAMRDQILWQMGLPLGKQELYEHYSLTPPEADDDALPPPPAHGGAPGLPGAAFAEGLSRSVVTQPDKLADLAVASVSERLKPAFTRALNALNEADNYDEAFVALYSEFPSLSFAELQESLERALFVANLRGRYEVQPKGGA